MPLPKDEPIWVELPVVLAIHDQLLAAHGGMPGLRDRGLLESAITRPRGRWAYHDVNDLFDCAASYGFGIAKNHAFNDGNKRTAFQAVYTFLGLNGRELQADEADVVEVMVGVADGTVSEDDLAAWLRANTPAKRRKRAR
ncbi:MAG TPA: type II toxin-antitoxin system death-on-curing family toxin [Gemmatimonadales bacterium]|jgi:death-on-curing protein